jgi:hypothetical protein
MKGPRIAIRGFAIESNRFAPVMTSEIPAFERWMRSFGRLSRSSLPTPSRAAPSNTHSSPAPCVTSNSGSFEVLTLRLVHVGHRGSEGSTKLDYLRTKVHHDAK